MVGASDYTDISQLPKHTFEEFTHFFEVYKTLEGTETYVTEILGQNEALEIIKRAIESYKEKFGYSE